MADVSLAVVVERQNKGVRRKKMRIPIGELMGRRERGGERR